MNAPRDNQQRWWRRPPAVTRLFLLVLVAWMVGDEINVLWGSGENRSVLFGRGAFEITLQLSALLCVGRGVIYKRHRLIWVTVGLGCMAWGAGDFYYTFVVSKMKEIPVPSLADPVYLVFYPLLFVGGVLLFRTRSGRASAVQWLDGLSAALAAAALSAAVALDAVLGTLGGKPLADATNLAYPVGDLLLLAGITGALVLCGWRGGRVWLWAGAGILMFCVADGVTLVEAAQGTQQVGAWYDVGWAAGLLCLATGAWSDVSDDAVNNKRAGDGLGHIAIPMVFAVISIGLLLYTGSQHLNWAARLLAAASLGVVLLRLTRTFRDHAELIAQRGFESKTDALTGLSNRRALTSELAAMVEHVSPEREGLVAIFDLDGFKHYNDTFGHPAGDALLARLSAKLQQSIAGRGRAYRMGGDEFCVLIDGVGEDDDDTIQRAFVALSEVGEGFAVRNSHGAARMPSEAADAESALRLADQRMYDDKGGGRHSAQRQSRDVLVQALHEHAAKPRRSHPRTPGTGRGRGPKTRPRRH